MHKVIESIYIDRPPDKVAEFMMDPANATLWQANLIDFELLDDEIRRGARTRGVSKVVGRKIEWEMEYSEVEPGVRSLLRTTKSPIDFTLEETFAPTGSGTTFTWHLEVETLGGFFGKLADPLVVRMYRRDARSNLEHLKELLEAD